MFQPCFKEKYVVVIKGLTKIFYSQVSYSPVLLTAETLYHFASK